MGINKVIEFTEFNWFYEKYKPLTPYGIDAKIKCRFITNANELNKIHAIGETVLSFIEEDNNAVLKIEHHLSRIDRLNDLDKEVFDAADLFLIKKLLIHFKAVASIMPNIWKTIFNSEFNSQKLLTELMPDNDDSEAFHLSSSFSDELLEVRNRISQTDELLNKIKKETLSDIKDKFELDFESREFILVDQNKSEKLDSALLYIELYDANLLKVKALFPKSYTIAQMEKKALLQQEAEAEVKVLKRLSASVSKEREQLKQYIEVIENIDSHLAKARVSNLFNLIKPEIDDCDGLQIDEGRFLSLEARQNRNGAKYTPLSATFDTNTSLLSGSNMGGKTVLFKTIGFLQLLTQLGFRVPALKFKTKLYDSIHILSTYENKEVEGLSSFGQEVFSLSSALENENKTTLILADELAKTTNATEAKAILYGVLKWVASHTNYTGFFSTHFIKLPIIEGVGKYRMKGLNRKEFEKHYLHNQEETIEDRIKLINSFMQFEVEIDKQESYKQDALSIASLLGLNKDIIKNANDYLGKTI
ncbi:MutS-related protein [Carboxylicivirga sp. N1Y90]|uniref:lysine 5,6-aminomutase reactivase ATPase KamC n=1 Tax=Carboxylicivirga fragile TaxID=3417571 RepID=UPI003D337321|nr:hypothetical protein [Marinilabiliaceae bacterium N1Y90]